MRIFKDERGISNLIATLILIAVAVVGGAFAYTAFREQAGSTTTSADLQMQDLTAQNIDSGGTTTTYCSVTLKNVGKQRLKDITVEIVDGPTLDDVDDLDPGQTGSDNHTEETNPLDAGETYAVQIEASTPDGGSITKTMTVRVKS